jgi:hypothetical protein
MKFRHHSLVLASALAVALPAWAGLTGDLKFDKAKYETGDIVNLTVSGMGTCGYTKVTWGDGKVDEFPGHEFGSAGVQTWTLPPHTYTVPGNFNVSVNAQNNAYQCGARNGSIEVALRGKANAWTTSASRIYVGDITPLTVGVSGEGYCRSPHKIRVLFTPKAGGVPKQVFASEAFPAGSAWPYKVIYTNTETQEGALEHFFEYGPGADGYGDHCMLPSGPGKTLTISVVAKPAAPGASIQVAPKVQVGPQPNPNPPAGGANSGGAKQPPTGNKPCVPGKVEAGCNAL